MKRLEKQKTFLLSQGLVVVALFLSLASKTYAVVVRSHYSLCSPILLYPNTLPLPALTAQLVELKNLPPLARLAAVPKGQDPCP